MFWNKNTDRRKISDELVYVLILSSEERRITAKTLSQILNISLEKAIFKLSWMFIKNKLNLQLFEMDEQGYSFYTVSSVTLVALLQEAQPLVVEDTTFTQICYELSLRKSSDKKKIQVELQKYAVDDYQNEKLKIDIQEKFNHQVIKDGEVIVWAIEHQGFLTIQILAAKAKINLDEARYLLEKLHLKGVFELEISENGVLKYMLHEV